MLSWALHEQIAYAWKTRDFVNETRWTKRVSLSILQFHLHIDRWEFCATHYRVWRRLELTPYYLLILSPRKGNLTAFQTCSRKVNMIFFQSHWSSVEHQQHRRRHKHRNKPDAGSVKHSSPTLDNIDREIDSIDQPIQSERSQHTKPHGSKPFMSIVIPLLNEDESLYPLY